MRKNPDGTVVPKKWDQETIRACSEAARKHIPDVWTKIASHDKGENIMTDSEFREFAYKLMRFIHDMKIADNHIDAGSLFSAVRSSMSR